MPRNFTHFCRVRFTSGLIKTFWYFPEVGHLCALVWDQLEEEDSEEL
jgi:hypothetical protein